MRTWKMVPVVLMLAVVVTGCPKKKPAQPAPVLDTETTTVAPPTTDVDTNPSPPVDQTPDPLSADLEEANRYAAAQGLLGDVYFDFDQYDLRADARDRLSKNAEFLKSHPQFTVTIEGHCDERGTNEYNLALGERRAAAARDYIVSLGVPADRLKTISYGEERPACTESAESCWSQNRRAHFVLTGRTNVG